MKRAIYISSVCLLLSAYFDLFLGWHLAYLILIYSPRFTWHQPFPENASSVLSVFNFISQLTSYFSSILPSFLHWRQQRRSRYGFDWRGSLFRTIGSAVTPIRDARVEETEADARRVQMLTGFDKRMVRTLRDHRHPMILECQPKFVASMRMSANWLIARWWVPQRCSKNGRRNVRE